MEMLIKEYERIKSHHYTLDFVYPDAERRKELKIINRDMTVGERSKVAKSLKDITDILRAIEDGDVQIQDLPPKVRERLKRLL